MAFNLGAGSRLLAPGINKVLFQAYKEREPEYTKIFNLRTSKRNYEEDLEFVGLGTMPTQPDGTSVIYADPIQGELKRYTHVSFGHGFRVTRQMMDDDLYNVTKPTKMAKELGKGARNVREVRAANVFNNGFTVADGFPKSGTQSVLFHASHALLGGGTLSNTATADLAQASFESALITFHSWTDENGIPVVKIPRTLLVPRQLIMVARELVGSEFKPYTQNNEINPTRADKIDLEVNHYLTDDDSWFVLSDKSDHDLNFYTRTDLTTEFGDDFDTGDLKVKAFQRFSVGWGDWRGVFGGLGA